MLLQSPTGSRLLADAEREVKESTYAWRRETLKQAEELDVQAAKLAEDSEETLSHLAREARRATSEANATAAELRIDQGQRHAQRYALEHQAAGLRTELRRTADPAIDKFRDRLREQREELCREQTIVQEVPTGRIRPDGRREVSVYSNTHARRSRLATIDAVMTRTDRLKEQAVFDVPALLDKWQQEIDQVDDTQILLVGTK